MISILDRWLVGRFLKAYLLFVSSAGLLFLVIDVFANMDSLLRHGLLTAAARRYGTMLPELYFMLSPYLTLLSGLWISITLQRNNELVPLYAAGYSARRLSMPLLATAAALALVSYADRELLLPALAPLRREARMKLDWEFIRPIPDGSDGVLSAQFYQPKERRLHRVRFVQLDAKGGEVRSVFAHGARFEEDQRGWRLTEGVIVDSRTGEDQVTPIGPDGYILETRIRLSDVEAAVDSPTYLSASQLRAQLERTPGFRQLEVQLYERFTQPLAGLVLLLVGFPIAIARTDGGGLFVRVLGFLAVCVAYFFTTTICFELGGRGALPPAVSALLPIGLFAGVGGGALFWVMR